MYFAYLPLLSGHALVIGSITAVDSIFPRAYGAEEFRTIGLVAQRVALISTVCIALPMSLMWLFASEIMQIFVGLDRPLCLLVQQYAVIRIPGLFLQGLQAIAQKSMYACSRTLPCLLIQMVSSCLVLVCMWLLVGHLHFGLQGVAAALTFQDFLTCGLYMLAAKREPRLQQCWSIGLSYDAWKGWSRYLRLAFPSCAIFIADWWSIDAITLMAAWLGRESMAQQSVLVAISTISYAVPSAWRVGVTAVCGSYVGKDNPIRARKACEVSVAMAVAFILLQSSLVIIFRAEIVALFTRDATLQQALGHTDDTYLVVVAFSTFEGVWQVLMGVVTATGKQATVLHFSIAANWLFGLPLGALLAFGSSEAGLGGLWGGKVAAELVQILALGLVVNRLKTEMALVIVSANDGPFSYRTGVDVGAVRT